MSLLDTLTFKRRTAFDTVVGFARDEAAGQATASDAEALQKALREANRTDGEYQALVEAFRHIEALTAEAKKLPGAEKAVSAAKAAEAMHQEETQRINEQRKQAFVGLVEATRGAQGALKTAAKAQAELEVLDLERPELFGNKSIDLDRFTLTWGENIIRRAAPDAPTRAVSREIFERENTRRNAIHERAVKETHEAWQRDVARWEAARPKNVLGEFLPGAAAPEFEIPDWGAIVALGWNTDLDQAEIA